METPPICAKDGIQRTFDFYVEIQRTQDYNISNK
jgi:hypothetical protein